MVTDSDSNAVIAIYETHPEAEAAVQALQKTGLEMTKLSVVGKDYHTEEQVVGYYNAGDRMKYWGEMGALWPMKRLRRGKTSTNPILLKGQPCVDASPASGRKPSNS